jgi:hypothetical protein
MKITRRQLRSIIKEEIAHPRDNLGSNAADVEFPIAVGYEGKSEIAYDQDELDDILDDIAPRGIKYSLDSLEDMEPRDRPAGAAIEQFGEATKITKRQLGRIIREAMQSDGKGWQLRDRSCDTHNMPPDEVAEAIAILQEFGYELGLPITVDSNNIAIDDALGGYPGEYTYEDFKCAIQATQGRGA